MAGLYIHIPFCHSKCAYCDFYSMPSRTPKITQRFCLAIISEFQQRRSDFDFSTIYIGGGTPSILPLEELRSIVNALPLDNIKEFTIEANPEDVTPEKADAWKSMGINRVSMGVQSLIDSELALIGRRHDAKRAVQAYHTLRNSGFDNISLDLIYGLPNQTQESWKYSLDTLLDLDPEHFSAYILSYEPRTRITAMLNSGRIKETSEEEIIAMYSYLTDKAKKRGYEHYEISNFAKPGKEAMHNSSYWDNTPYLGLGPGAYSFDGVRRAYNPSNLMSYLETLESGNIPSVIEEEEEYNRLNDKVMTSLRTAKGLDLATIAAPRRNQLLKDAKPYLSDGSLMLDGDSLFIPEQAWLISDAIISDLFQLE